MPLLCSLAAATAAMGALTLPFPMPVHLHVAQAVARDGAAPPATQALDAHPAPFGPAAEPAQLERARGGTDTHTNNNMQVNGTVGGNSATHVVTGANTISAGAFADASGIPMVIQNTGSNVLIQNATIINLRME